jgi:uncharacterized protein YecE (DUF72 family)
MNNPRIGTCSWKYPSWTNLVYSSPRPQNFLAEYAERYSTVEIDQWFWSLFGINTVELPKTETVEEYVASVPDDFIFTVKVPNSITLTHLYKQYTDGALVENKHFLSNNLLDTFLGILEPMKSRLGPLMFQFEYLNRQKMPSQNEFIDRIGRLFDKAPPGYQYAIESRNPNYLNEQYFSFLQSAGISHVFIQGYYMPEITTVYTPHAPLIDNTAVIRLHGYDRKAIEKKTQKRYDRIVEPLDDELPGVISMIQDMRDRGVTVYLNVNNHYEGSAPLTIAKIQSALANTD